jgi:hypothetical protein
MPTPPRLVTETEAWVANTTRTQRCRACHSEWAKASNVYSKPRRWINANGYVVLNQQHAHPNADRRGQILEHVKVMSATLGRPLLPGENVHHKNGVRDDNRPENLELWVVSQPSGQRPADLVAWALEVIDRYGSECGWHGRLSIEPDAPQHGQGRLMRDRLELIAERLTCRVKGHKWDSDRPSGPLHLRDICWRCDAVRDHA